MSSTATTVLGPPRTSVGVLGWIRGNLLSTWYNTLLTLLSFVLLVVFLWVSVPWLFVDADWTVITENLKLFFVGQYPPEQMWRVSLGVVWLALLFGISWGTGASGVMSIFARVIAIGFGLAALVFLFLEIVLSLGIVSITACIWLLAVPVAVVVGYSLFREESIWSELTDFSRPVAFISRFFLFRGRSPQTRWLVLAWILSFAAILVLLRGFEGLSWLPLVETGVWGGLLLTFLLAVLGIVASFPLGVLLALGRRSNLPVVSVLCTMFIEGVRGVPLVTLLFMTQVILPLFLPEYLPIDRITRAFLAITLFSAAYMAENIRGGLQAVPTGQIEAAKALGMSGFSTMLFIVLPQALRAVIPAIVGQFIGLFKDTSLVVIVGLLDIVGIGRAVVQANPEWIDAQREVYVFLGVVFWVFTYAMSYASRRLETTLGVGIR